MHYNNWRRVARRAAIVFYPKNLDPLEYLENLDNPEPKFCISLNLH